MFDKRLLNLPGARKLFVLLALVCIVQAILTIGEAICIASVCDKTFVDEILGLNGLGLFSAQTSFWQNAAFFLVCFAVFFAVKRALDDVKDGLCSKFAARESAKLQNQLLACVFQSYGEVARDNGTPLLVASAIDGCDKIETYLKSMLLKMSDLMTAPIVLLIAVFLLDVVSGVLLLISYPVIVFFMILIGNLAGSRARDQLDVFNRMSNAFIDGIRGLPTLKAFGAQDKFEDDIYDSSERFREATMRTLTVAQLSGGVLDLIATLSVAAVAMMLGLRLVSGDMTLFPSLACLAIAPEFFNPIRAFASEYHASIDGKASLESVLGIIANSAFQAEANDSAEPGDGNTATLDRWSESSTLSITGLSFRYASSDHDTISCKNLEIGGYEKIALVGPSGAGKSTLARILSGFASAQAGSFELNGSDPSNTATLSTLDCPWWHNQVIYLPQFPYLFRATLRDNITLYSPEATDEQVDAAVEAMGLTELVNELPNGLDTFVGENERALSGGQAQRVALARAFLDTSHRILVFDEPTAHLDIETELELKERMLPLFDNHLVLFATHRLHWLQNMDRVVRIEPDGTVSESEVIA